jgi:hypothetical protein
VDVLLRVLSMVVLYDMMSSEVKLVDTRQSANYGLYFRCQC